MNEQLNDRICLIHQQEGLAADLSSTNGQQNPYLCSRCVSEKFFSKNSIIWLNEVEEIFKEMRIKEFNHNKKQYEQSLEQCQTLRTNVLNYQEKLANSLTKLVNLIQQKEEELKSQLESQTEPSKVDFKNSYLLKLTQYMQGDMKFDESQSQNNEQENDFFQIIKEQIELLKSEEQLSEIVKQIDEIQNQKYSKGEQASQIFKEEEQKKIFSLPHCCKAHGNQFTMITLEQKQIDERLLCPECIQDCEHKLTSLMRLNQMWIDYQSKYHNSFLSFHTERQEKLNQATNIFQNFQEKLQSICNDILKLFIQQNKSIKNEILSLNNFKIEKNIQKLDLRELRKIINTLSQKDQMEQVQLTQKQIESQDKIFYNEITQKIQMIEQNHFQSCLQYNQIVHQNDIDENFIKKLKMKELKDYLKDRLFTQELFDFESNLIESELQSLFETWKLLLDQAKVHLINQKSNNQIYSENHQNSINQLQKKLSQIEKKLILLNKTIDQYDFSSQTDENRSICQSLISLKHKVIPSKQKLLQIQNSIIIQNHQSKRKKSPFLEINSKLINLQQKILIKQNVKYEDIFKFSKSYKHESVTLSEDCKTATIKNRFCLCLCDQPIPNSKICEINFKIKSNVFVGVCVKDIIQKDYSLSNFGKVGCGQYLLAYDGNLFANYVWNDSNNYKNISDLRFTANDVVSVEVNLQAKQITWKKKEKNKSFTFDIKNDQEIYFAVLSWQDNQSIEIV